MVMDGENGFLEFDLELCSKLGEAEREASATDVRYSPDEVLLAMLAAITDPF